MLVLSIRLALFGRKSKQNFIFVVSVYIWFRDHCVDVESTLTKHKIPKLFANEFIQMSIWFTWHLTYRMRATGNACGSHNNAKLSRVLRTNILIFESDEKAGAFDPSGSIDIIENKNLSIHFSIYYLLLTCANP